MSTHPDNEALPLEAEGPTSAERLVIPLPSPKELRAQLLAIETAMVSELAQAADAFVRENGFTQRQARKAWNTVRKEIATLSNFMAFLSEAGIDLSFHLAEEPRLWSAITFGLVESFLVYEQRQGYAIKTLNDHLDVIKLYAKLAHRAGFQTADQLLAITTLSRIRGPEGSRIDASRTRSRIGYKKPDPTFLTRKEFAALLNRPDTPQGWRDRVAILLMYDLSLRPSEAVSLKLHDVDMEEGTLRITRHKTSTQQKARLKDRLFLAMQQYLRRRRDTSSDAPLLVRSRKDGELVERLPRGAPEREEDRSGGRRPRSANHPLYVKLQGSRGQEAREEREYWTPPMTTRGLREHLHALGLDLADALYGEHDDEQKRPPRTRRPAPQKQINLTSYDGRHDWTRSAIRGGSDPITVTKAGGWSGHSAMVMRYYGELEIINEDITLER